MSLKDELDRIRDEVAGWEGVSTEPHRFGGIEFRFGKAEVGHIHGNGMLDIPFPLTIRSHLLAENVVSKHHVLPDSGWVTFMVRSENDVKCALWLLKLSYLRYALKGGSIDDPQVQQELRDLNPSPPLRAVLEQVLASPKVARRA